MTSPKAWVKLDQITKDTGKFTVSPLERGMGTTLGNSLRRALLSSLEGSAVTSVKVEGVNHEFSTIPNVVEDTIDVISNLKGLVFKNDSSDTHVIRLECKGAGKVYGKDFKLPSGLKIVNPNHYIAEVSQGGSLKIEAVVKSGVGYRSSESNLDENKDAQAISIDSSFSPVLRVNHQVENVRVGKELNHDNLILDVTTNGSVSPEEAIQLGAQILIEQLKIFSQINQKPKEEAVENKSTRLEDKKDSALNLTIDDLELSARSSNCLKRAGIDTVNQLVNKEYEELLQIKNFGKKSIEEINDKLRQYNLILRTGEAVEV